MRAAALLHLAWSFVPSRAPRAIARALTRQANAARDARRWDAAAALYEEALRIAPAARVHKQCGHMYKESGDFAAAEHQYALAERLDPGDADLALQQGHFFKVAGRPDAAEAAYARALVIHPGWDEPAGELARLRGRGGDADEAIDLAMLAPELLPGGTEAGGTALRETIQVRRLGTMRLRRAGAGRVLRGVEAIRGFLVARPARWQLVLLIDDVEAARQPLAGAPAAGAKLAKYPFNLWHDLSDVAPGEHRVELRFVDERGHVRAHRAAVTVLPPVAAAALPGSDAVVDPPPPGEPLVAAINARPSVVRPAARTVVPDAVRAILVQRADQLGDLAVSVPALRRLRALFPAARVVLLATPANAGLAERLDCIDEVIVAPLVEQPDGRRALPLAEQRRLRKQLAPHAFDIALDLSEGSDSRPLLRLSGAPFLYGFKDRETPWLSAGFELNARDPVNGLEAAAPARKLVALVEALGALAAGGAAPARLAPDAEALARHGLAPGERYVVLHAGARLAFSRWPHFPALADRLIAETGLPVIYMDDVPPAGLAAGPRLRIVAGRIPFAEFDALVGSAALFVGNDSGPKHLAALRGTPTISLHMARLNWGEWGQEGTGAVISRRVPCAGCAIDRDPAECGQGFACLVHITPDEVAAEARRLLATG